LSTWYAYVFFGILPRWSEGSALDSMGTIKGKRRKGLNMVWNGNSMLPMKV